MKRNTILVSLLLLAAFALSACARTDVDDQPAKDADPAGNRASTEVSGQRGTSTPAFLNDLGKPLNELKSEYPDGEFVVRPDGFPDNAAVCFGTPAAEYLYYFFGTQGGDAEKVMNECGEQLQCAGFLTTAGVLFPDMEEDMSFEAFFALIGADEYEYFGENEDTITAEGWLNFRYHDMEVMVNTNEVTADGGWNFTGEKIVKKSAPVSIVDTEISSVNQELADAAMFD